MHVHDEYCLKNRHTGIIFKEFLKRFNSNIILDYFVIIVFQSKALVAQ